MRIGIVFMIGYMLYKAGAMGAGDIKTILALSTFMGVWQLTVYVVVSMIAGIVIAIILRDFRKIRGKHRFHMGYGFLAGYIIIICCNQII